MVNKHIEITTAVVRTEAAAGKAVVAIWFCADNSLVIVYLDLTGTELYIFWLAPKSHQLRFSSASGIVHVFTPLCMGMPLGIDDGFSRNDDPKKTVSCLPLLRRFARLTGAALAIRVSYLKMHRS